MAMNSTHIKAFKVYIGYNDDDFIRSRISVIVKYKLSRHKHFRACKFSIDAFFKDEDIPYLVTKMYTEFKQKIFTK